jgi:hypothetical protein
MIDREKEGLRKVQLSYLIALFPQVGRARTAGWKDRERESHTATGRAQIEQLVW